MRLTHPVFRLFSGLTLGLLTACGGAIQPGPQPLPGTPVPAELQGAWRYGTISSVDYYDPVTGSWGAPSGTGDLFTLSADGAYERSRLLQVTTYGCESYVFIWEVGTVALTDTQLTFQPAESAVKSQMCTPADTEETRNTVEGETYGWTLGPDDYGETVLTLIFESGETSLYDRP